jgi:hypothetical protein
MSYLILNSKVDIPAYERTIRDNYAYHPVLHMGEIILYRLKQKFFPNTWVCVYSIMDQELRNDIKIVYEYLLIKYL